jgi:glutamate 5-kinase
VTRRSHPPVVVKLGSSLVVSAEGTPELPVFADVARQLSALVEGGTPVCVVSSGAIALGAAAAGLAGRRSSRRLPLLQAASALGQSELQRLWQQAFEPFGVLTAQILLTSAEITDRRSYINVRSSLRALFQIPAVPILNENDAVATDEISFGDNDVLAAQIAVLVRAATLILLTSTEGVLSGPPDVDGSELLAEGDDTARAVFGVGSSLGSGGMESKVRAAQLAQAGGVTAFVAAPSSLAAILAGEAAGTRFKARATDESAFKLWLRYGMRAIARITIDAGAARALQSSTSSLLAVGVTSCSEAFRAGDGVEIYGPAGELIARGIASVEAGAVAGRPTDVEVVHRDRMIVV